MEAGTERIMACLRDKVPEGGGGQLPPAPPMPGAVIPQQTGGRYERDGGGFARSSGSYVGDGGEEWGMQGGGPRSGGGMRAVTDGARHSHGQESKAQTSFGGQHERTFGHRHGEIQQAYDGGYTQHERTFGQQSMGQGDGRENSDPRKQGRENSMKQGLGDQQASGLHPQVQQQQQQPGGGAGGGGGGGKRAELEQIMKSNTQIFRPKIITLVTLVRRKIKFRSLILILPSQHENTRSKRRPKPCASIAEP